MSSKDWVDLYSSSTEPTSMVSKLTQSRTQRFESAQLIAANQTKAFYRLFWIDKNQREILIRELFSVDFKCPQKCIHWWNGYYYPILWAHFVRGTLLQLSPFVPQLCSIVTIITNYDSRAYWQTILRVHWVTLFFAHVKTSFSLFNLLMQELTGAWIGWDWFPQTITQKKL